jgi:hypothetical protein
MLEAKRAELAKTGRPPDHTIALVGQTEAQIRAKFGELMSIVNTQWVYETVNGRCTCSSIRAR